MNNQNPERNEYDAASFAYISCTHVLSPNVGVVSRVEVRELSD